MADYRIWGRIEKLADGFRAVASAIPDQPGAGPDPADVVAAKESSIEICRSALGRITYDLASALTRRGDRVVWLDVR